MKTTIDIKDDLLMRAKKLAKRSGKPLRAIVEESLMQTLTRVQARQAYKLPDLSAGDPEAQDALEWLSWQDLRDEIYGEPRQG